MPCQRRGFPAVSVLSASGFPCFVLECAFGAWGTGKCARGNHVQAMEPSDTPRRAAWNARTGSCSSLMSRVPQRCCPATAVKVWSAPQPRARARSPGLVARTMGSAGPRPTPPTVRRATTEMRKRFARAGAAVARAGVAVKAWCAAPPRARAKLRGPVKIRTVSAPPRPMRSMVRRAMTETLAPSRTAASKAAASEAT